jgi:prevent-host-death family protein
MSEFMKAGKFKTHCLKVIDRVKRTRKRIIITKRNVPVAQMVPIDEEETSLFGKMKGTIHFLGNVIDPIGVEWNANN